MIEPINVCELEAGRPNTVFDVPDNRRNQKRKYHGKSRSGTDIEHQFNREQRDDTEGDSAGRGQHADKIPQTGPCYSNPGLQGVR